LNNVHFSKKSYLFLAFIFASKHLVHLWKSVADGVFWAVGVTAIQTHFWRSGERQHGAVQWLSLTKHLF